MKRIIAFVILVVLWAQPVWSHAQPAGDGSGNITGYASETGTAAEKIRELLPAPSVAASGAVVLEVNSGKTIFEKEAHKKFYPASTTKVLTALLAIEKGNLDKMVTVGDEVWMIAGDSSLAGLSFNEQISLRDLVYGLLINSGNDAANTIAVHIARTVSGENLETTEALSYFAKLMNERAKEAGARNSNFVNAHGYHDPDHYTTAYDLAMITRAALKYPFFREAFSTLSMTTAYWGTGEPRYWRTKNKLFNPNEKEYYEYAIGGKTGWTSAAGSCLISAAARDGQELVSVIMKSTSADQWHDTKSMFDYGFNNYEYSRLFVKGAFIDTLPLENYDPEDWGSLAVEIGAEDFGDVFLATDIPRIESSINWNPDLLAKPRDDFDTLPRLLAPIQKGQEVGQLTFSLDGRVIASSPLLASRDVRAKKPAIIERIIPDPGSVNYWTILKTLIIGIACLIFVLKMVAVFIKLQRRRRQRYIYRR